MNFSITIPQLFYDLIARILPGFLFCILYKVILFNTGYDNIDILKFNSTNFVTSISSSLAYTFIFYFIGSICTPFILFSFKKKVMVKIQGDKDELSLRKKYQEIRIKNESVGFRLVKLRAEAKLMECGRTIITFFILILLILVFFDIINLLEFPDIKWYEWVLKFS